MAQLRANIRQHGAQHGRLEGLVSVCPLPSQQFPSFSPEALKSGRRPGRPWHARRAFGGNRRLLTLAPPAADPRHEKRGDHRVTDAPVIYSVSCV